MSTAGDLYAAIKKIILVDETLNRLSDEVKALSDDVKNHERRLIRIETALDLGSKRSRLILPGD